MRTKAPKLTAFVRLVGPRYRALNVPPFVIGALGSGGDVSAYLSLGVAAVLTREVAQELANKHADRVEDAVDYPERRRLYSTLGDATVHRLLLTAIVGYVCLLVAMRLVADASWRVLVPWVILMAGALAYSYGPRLKRRPIAGPFVIAVNQAVLFHAGWRYWGEATAPFLVGLLLLVTAGMSLMFSKDAPNLEGDGAIGYRSVYLRLRRARLRTRLLLFLPYIEATAVVMLGVVGSEFLLVWVAAPLTWAFARVVGRADTREEREVVREIGHFGKLALNGTILMAVYPAVATAAIVAGALLWSVLCTLWVHTERGLLSRARVRLAVDLVRARAGVVSTPA